MVSGAISGKCWGRVGFGGGSKPGQAVSPWCNRSDGHRIPQIVPDTILGHDVSSPNQGGFLWIVIEAELNFVWGGGSLGG
jgi:hypothetical protein